MCQKRAKKGHVARVCHYMKEVSSGKDSRPRKKAELTSLVENEFEDSDLDLPVHKIATCSTHAITVKLKIQGKPVVMEVDTGAVASVLSEETYKKLFEPDSEGSSYGPQNLYRRKNICTRRNSCRSQLPTGESSALLDCCKGQGS